MVVVDGPMRKAAKDMNVEIDSPDGRTFKVTVTE
jgi:hypothetical protein